MPDFGGDKPAQEPTAHTPSTPRGHEGDIAGRLEAYKLPEPGQDALARIWDRVAAETQDSPVYTVVQALERLNPAEPDQAALDRAWRRVAHSLDEEPPRRALLLLPIPSPGIFLAACAVLLILSFVWLGNLAEVALPGSFWYPVKLATEAVRLQLAFSPAARGQLALELADRRRVEAQSLVAGHASSDLVAQTLKDSLAYLNLATPYVLGAQVATRLQAWVAEIGHWPVAYQTPAAATFAQWAQNNPSISSGITLPTPTVEPISTGTPVPSTATPTLPTVEATPTVPIQVTPIPSVPNPVTPTVALPSPSVSGFAPTVAVPTLAAPTVQATPAVPTIAPTSSRQTLPAPTLSVPTLPRPTVRLPTLPKPTLPAPTLPLP